MTLTTMDYPKASSPTVRLRRESCPARSVSTKRTCTYPLFAILFPILLGSFLQMNALAADVSLAWDANTESDLAGYRVYYGTSSRQYGGPIDVGNPTPVGNQVSYIVTNLTPGVQYYFAVTAYNSSGSESGYSNEVTTVVGSADTTPPTISGVSTSRVTYNSANVAWTTNESADSQVEYGLTATYGSATTLDAVLSLTHTQTLGGLSAGCTYHFRVKSKDAAGNLATSGDFIFTTGATPDTTPPVISSVTSSSITYSGATITWTTNEAADGQVEYGNQPTFGSATTINSTMATSHSQVLGNLSASTVYYFRVKSKDVAGNLAVSNSYIFTTSAPPDTTPPVISSVANSGITGNSATVTWTTNEAADGLVEYGKTTSYGFSTALNSALVTAHSQVVTGLAASTTYHYRVKSKDAAGNLAASADFTFLTATATDTTPPVISAVASSAITDMTAKVTWATNEASDGQVEYGPTSAYGTATALNTAKLKAHSQDLSGLAANSTYHLRVKSRDAAGNLTISADFTFTTTNPIDITTGLVAAYGFDEGAGTTTSDASGSANTGTLNNASWTSNSKFGKALLFGGSQSYVSAPASRVPATNNPQTIAYWAYLTSKTSATQAVITLPDANKTTGNEPGLKTSKVGVWQHGSSWLVSASQRAAKEWHHYAYTFDGQTHRLYIDGVQASSSTIVPSAVTADSIQIGRWIGGSEYFKGVLDEIRIYARALNQTEIAAVMSRPISTALAASANPADSTPDSGMNPESTEGKLLAGLGNASGFAEAEDWDDPSSMYDPKWSEPYQERIDIQMGQEGYTLGDVIAAPIFRLTNPNAIDQSVQLKTWLSVPGLAPLSIADVGADGQYVLPAGLNDNYGPLALLPVTSTTPRGIYWLNARMLNPVTGRTIAEDTNPFNVYTATDPAVPPAEEASLTRSIELDGRLTGSVYSVGDTVSLACYRIANPGPKPIAIELKVWLEAPGSSPIALFSIGDQETLVLSAGSEIQLDPMPAFTITTDLPSGTYRLKSRLIDPTTGSILLQECSQFRIN